MALDSSIYFQQQGVQLPDPVNKLAQLGQVQQFQNQNALAQLQLSQAQRANDQAEGLNRLYQAAVKPDGTVDRAALFTSAAQQGLGSVIPGLQKQFAEADKATADVGKTKAETGKITTETLNATLQQGRDILTQANDPATARQWLQAQYANPDTAAIFNKLGPVDQALARFDQQTATPEGFARWKQGAMLTAQELVKQTMPDANTVLNAQVSRQNNADTNATSRANNNATVGATIRGQNLSYEAGKVPPGYRRTSDGNLEAIPGGPAEKDKAPTEFQGKNAVFGSRAEAADKILTDLTGKYNVGATNMKAGMNGAAGTLLNYALSPESQKAEQAQRDFINAVLRQESGAAIAESEFDNARKQYFPQPGDSNAVVAQKAANRQLVIQGFKDNSGPLAKKSFGKSPAGAAPTVPPDIGDLLNKYGG